MSWYPKICMKQWANERRKHLWIVGTMYEMTYSYVDRPLQYDHENGTLTIHIPAGVFFFVDRPTHVGSRISIRFANFFINFDLNTVVVRSDDNFIDSHVTLVNFFTDVNELCFCFDSTLSYVTTEPIFITVRLNQLPDNGQYPPGYED